jgi:hypothetical protein
MGRFLLALIPAFSAQKNDRCGTTRRAPEEIGDALSLSFDSLQGKGERRLKSRFKKVADPTLRVVRPWPFLPLG